MKIVRLIAAVALLTTVAIISVSAQQQQPKPGPTTAPAASAPQANVAVPDSKLAMIYSDAFLDPKTGIARFNSLLTTLNREFQPRQTELQGLQQRINTLSKEIDDTQNVAAPDSLRQKRDQLAQMNTDFKRRAKMLKRLTTSAAGKSSCLCNKTSARLWKLSRKPAALL